MSGLTTKRKALFGLAVAAITVPIVVAVVVAFGGDNDRSSPEAGLPNPASVFCVERGGSVRLVTDAAGNQSGLCQLPGGTEVEEWDHYRRFHDEGGGAGLANPAAVFCEELGGVVSGVEPMCALPDGNVVDAWEYFRAHSDMAP